MPHLNIDPIVAASGIISSLQVWGRGATVREVHCVRSCAQGKVEEV